MNRYRRARHDHRVVVLTYHDVTGGTHEPEGVVSAKRFAEHLQYLKAHYRIIRPSEAVAALEADRLLRTDLAAITFDDGYAGNYEFALPVLRAEGVPAAVFVTTGFLDGTQLWFDTARRFFDAYAAGAITVDTETRKRLEALAGASVLSAGTERAMQTLKTLDDARRAEVLPMLRAHTPGYWPTRKPLSWEQVRELCRSNVEIGCHTVNHPILAHLPPEEQRFEIVGSRDRIAAEIGTAPTLFAYPNGAAGDYDGRTIELLREAGFTAAFTTTQGSNRRGCDLYRLKRIGVGPDATNVLAARMAGVFDSSLRKWLPAPRHGG